MSATAAPEKKKPAKVRVGQQVRQGLVRDIKKHLDGVDAIVVSKLEKIKTREINQLRQSLVSMNSDFIIVKNSLGKISFRESGLEGLDEAFTGTCGISPVRGDVSAVAKALSTFAKDHEGFVMQGGLLKGQVLQGKDLTALAKLPSREVLLSQLAGIIQSPLRALAFVANAPIRQFALTLAALVKVKEKSATETGGSAKQGGGEPAKAGPKAEAPKTEAPAAETPKEEPPKAETPAPEPPKSEEPPKA